jgi:hypothetical protein
MAFTVKTTLSAGSAASPWVQITDAVIRVRVLSGSVLVEVADDASGTSAGRISSEATNSQEGVFTAPIREYMSAETGAFYRLVGRGPSSAGDLSSGDM